MIAYLSHALGEAHSNLLELTAKGDDIARAGRWFRFIVETTSWTVCWPWYPYVTYLDWRWMDRSRNDQARVIRVSNVLVLAGPEVTDHMLDDRDEANYMRVPILDLTELAQRNAGEPPTERGEPAMSLDAARAYMRMRCLEIGIVP